MDDEIVPFEIFIGLISELQSSGYKRLEFRRLYTISHYLRMVDAYFHLENVPITLRISNAQSVKIIHRSKPIKISNGDAYGVSCTENEQRHNYSSV